MRGRILFTTSTEEPTTPEGCGGWLDESEEAAGEQFAMHCKRRDFEKHAVPPLRL